ncbi:MAG TPA: M50 family metallopeptidase [Solirubrobacteraceae bacterium]|nr:M50 family metallopeptidase [Solirubrobacteraceae bacterium]
MDFVFAFLGFVALIVLHEAGHFTAAKAVGMRVERFCLFFPPLIAKVKRGDTEYGIGAIPLGGYVKITGMSPNEDIPAELLPRAYYNQPVWKRIVVIAAGPAVNIALAIVIVWVLLMSSGEVSQTVTKSIAAVDRHGAAAHVLKPGDQIVSVDGVTGSEQTIHRLIERHRCAGTPTNGCRATTPANLVVRRDGHLVHVSLRPRYEKVSLGGGKSESEMLIGIEFAARINHPGFLQAGSDSVTKLWAVSKDTVSTVVRIFEPKERRQLHGVVGTYDETANYFATSTTEAFEVLALISLSLGIINLFPFLPLDGGHIFWAVAEKVRGRRIPFSVMERAGVVGFVLILVLFVIGLSNDITGLSNGTFQVH